MLVVGFGNTLVGDDGAGPAVVERLLARGLPPGMRVADGGQDALRLAGLWAGEEHVWLVDALVRGAPPGRVHRLEHDEVLAIPQRHGTAHQLSLPECLRWLAVAFPALGDVRYRLWGIEPQRLEVREGLTESVRRGVVQVAEEIVAAHAGSSQPVTDSHANRGADRSSRRFNPS